MKIAYIYETNALSRRATHALHEQDARLDWRITCANFGHELTEEIETRLAALPDVEVVVEDQDVTEHFALGVSVVYDAEDFFKGPPVTSLSTPEQVRQAVTEVVDALLAQPERWAAWREQPRFACFHCRRPIAHGATHFALDGSISQWYPDHAETGQIRLHEDCRRPFARRILAGAQD